MYCNAESLYPPTLQGCMCTSLIIPSWFKSAASALFRKGRGGGGSACPLSVSNVCLSLASFCVPHRLFLVSIPMQLVQPFFLLGVEVILLALQSLQNQGVLVESQGFDRVHSFAKHTYVFFMPQALSAQWRYFSNVSNQSS